MKETENIVTVGTVAMAMGSIITKTSVTQTTR